MMLNQRTGKGGTSRAFTLVELLVVIGIIALLIGLIVPLASGVRKRGYEVRTRALMAKINAACHAYYNDFHAYPGLLDENSVAPGTPPAILGVPTVTSSENLVLSLLGGVSIAKLQFDPNLVKSGAQSLNPADPKQYPAYLDVQTGELSPTDNMAMGANDSVIPEFVDAYPDFKPIVYLRARPGAKGIVNDPSDNLGNGDPQYDLRKMTVYLQPESTTKTLGGNYPPPGDNRVISQYASWYDYLRNPGLTPANAQQAPAVEVPRGKDAFLLISAGTDRIWGTTDDIFSGE